MHSELPKFLVPVVYLIPALIAFYEGLELRKRFDWTENGIRVTPVDYFFNKMRICRICLEYINASRCLR